MFTPIDFSNVTIDKIDELYNEYTSFILQSNNKISQLNVILKTPEGDRLKKEVTNIAIDIIEILKPALNKGINELNDLIKKEVPIVTDMAEKAVLGLPGIGTAVAAGEEALDAAGAVAAATNTVSQIANVGVKTYSKLQEPKTKLEKLYNDVVELYEKANKYTSDMIDSVQNNVNKFGQQIESSKNGMIDSVQNNVNKFGQQMESSKNGMIDSVRNNITNKSI